MTLFRQLLVVTILALSVGASEDDNGADYGVDCSWPVHSTDFSCGDLLGDRKKVYDEYMDGCRAKWGKKGAARCDENEQTRLSTNRRQPQGMVVRYNLWFLNYDGLFALDYYSQQNNKCRVNSFSFARTTHRPDSRNSELQSHS
jgi:hypothetical protein